MKITLYIVRHGKTEFNQQRIITGQHDSTLLPEGVEGSQQCGNFLSGVNFDKVYVSDLGRTLATLHHMGLGPGVKEPRLRDTDFKEFNGKPWDEYREAEEAYRCKIRKELLNAQPGSSSDSTQKLEIPGKESSAEVRARMTSLIQDTVKDLVENHSEGSANVLFVTHCYPALQCAWMLQTYSKAKFYKDISTVKAHNNSISEYCITANDSGDIEEVECIKLFCVDHLPVVSLVN